jgi:membrane fusion protein (multidrug efflux system)
MPSDSRYPIRPPRSVVTSLAVFLLLALASGACQKSKEAEKTQGGATPPPPTVLVTEVVQRTVPIYSEFVGRTEAQDTVEIRARVAAFLEAQHYTEGTVVKKSQVLFTLDKREYEAQLQQARAQMSKAQADLAFAQDKATVETAKANLDVARAQLGRADTDVGRLKPLAEQRAVPQQDYDTALSNQQAARASVESRRASVNTAEVNQRTGTQQAEAAIEAAKAAVAQAELNVSYCTIRSPIEGLAGKRDVAPGNLVGRGDATLLTIVSSINPIRVVLSISEAEYLRFTASVKKRGARDAAALELTLADGSVFPQKGRVIIADRAVDLKTGTLSLTTEFPNPEGLLRPGQFGRVRAAAETAENAILVPQRAVQEIQGAKSVLVVGADNMVTLRTIRPGESVGDLLIVRDGVQPGERVIVDGIQKARPGAKVNPQVAPAGSPSGAKPAGSPSGAKPAGSPSEEEAQGQPPETKPAETKPPAKAGEK